MKKIQYLRVVLTHKCNLKCFFCHKEGIDTKGNSILKKDELIKCLQILCDSGIRKIKFMGGEPTLYPELSEIIKWLKEKEIKMDISMISNGIASNEVFEGYIRAGIDRINISLHGIDNDTFVHVTKGNHAQLSQTIDTIKYLKGCGKLGKVNYVLLKGVNEDEFKKVLEFVNREKIVLDVLNYLGINDEEIKQYRYTFNEIISIINQDYCIESSATHRNMYSLDSQRLKLRGGGEINLKVNQLNESDFLKACQSCSKKPFCIEGISAIRLTTEGIIKPCLFRDDLTYDLLSDIHSKDMNEIVERVQKYLEEL